MVVAEGGARVGERSGRGRRRDRLTAADVGPPGTPAEDVGRAGTGTEPAVPGAPGGSGRRAAGELETAVLGVLWSAPVPLSAGAVQEALNGVPAYHLAYNTVLTILVRLHDKGLVARERAGRGHVYAPTRAHDEAMAERMSALLGEGLDHAAVLTRFVARLSPDDERALRALLQG